MSAFRRPNFPRCVTLAALLIASSNSWSAPTILAKVNFDDGVLPVTGGWQFGSQFRGEMSISTDTARNRAGSPGSVIGKYPASAAGGMYLWGAYNFDNPNLSDVYVEWWAKMPELKHGLKFMKIFGQAATYNGIVGVANTTFGLDYTGVDNGSMYCIGFGDGTGPANDTQNLVLFGGQYKNWIGRSFPNAVVATPQNTGWASKNWDNDSWHHFRAHAKFNSGTSPETEKPDGEYYLEIDGRVYVDAKGLFNRHFSNKPLQKIVFFDWVQGNPAFEVWYDDITISTGGFVDSGGSVSSTLKSPPKAPTLPTLVNPN